LRLLINPQTGEVVEDERDILIHQLEAEKRGQSLQIGLLKKELRELRAVEPEAQHIKEVLGYWREKCNPNATAIAPGGKRWEKVRARFRDNLDGRDSWTTAELKLAVDGALLDPFLNGTDPKSKADGFLDATTIFRDDKQVERLMHLAVGFKVKAGVGVPELLEVGDQLGHVSWNFLLQTCSCGHKRIEHAHSDPTLEGRELCFLCDCGDWDLCPFDEFNQRHDEHLRRWFGKAA
jgi:hypothetical protein